MVYSINNNLCVLYFIPMWNVFNLYNENDWYVCLSCAFFFPPEQRDTNGLTAENSELKLRLQTMEQQVHLQDGEDLLGTFY